MQTMVRLSSSSSSSSSPIKSSTTASSSPPSFSPSTSSSTTGAATATSPSSSSPSSSSSSSPRLTNKSKTHFVNSITPPLKKASNKHNKHHKSSMKTPLSSNKSPSKASKSSLSQSSSSRRKKTPSSKSTKPTRTLFHYFSPSPQRKKASPNNHNKSLVIHSSPPPSTPPPSTSHCNSSSVAEMNTPTKRPRLATINANVLASVEVIESSKSSSSSKHDKNKSKNDCERSNNNNLKIKLAKTASSPQTTAIHNNKNDRTLRTVAATTTSNLNDKKVDINDTIRATNTSFRIENGNDEDAPMSKKMKLSKYGHHDNKIELSSLNLTPNINALSKTDAFKLGLIRIPSAETTLTELCQSIHDSQNHNSQSSSSSSLSIYPLFNGAILGRNERITTANNSSNKKSNNNKNKMNLDIPIHENGVSRKHLIVKAIHPNNPNSSNVASNVVQRNMKKNIAEISNDPKSLLDYLNYQRETCPVVEIEASLKIVNSVKIVKIHMQQNELKNKESDIDGDSSDIKALNEHLLLEKGVTMQLKVGDSIVFDAYNCNPNKKNKKIKRNSKKKHNYEAQFIYRVIAFHPVRKLDDSEDISNPQLQQRLQPSRRAKDMLDTTIEKIVKDDLKAVGGVKVHSCSKTTKKNEDVVLEVKNSLQGKLIVPDELSPIISNKKTPLQSQRPCQEISTLMKTDLADEPMMKRNDADIKPGFVEGVENKNEEHFDFDIDSDDETMNLSQDSFFESVEEKKQIKRSVEMPPMIGNYLWRALNSSQPQFGFGFLMHMSDAMNTIPNVTLSRNLSDFLSTGPLSDDIHFKDYRRTELIGIYMRHLLTKMSIQTSSRHNTLNFAPSSWTDLEQILKLPLTEVEGDNLDSIKFSSSISFNKLDKSLQMSSNSLQVIGLILEVEVMSLKKNDMSQCINNPMVKLFLGNEIRNSLKSVVQIAMKCWVLLGHLLMNDQCNDKVDKSMRDHCASEAKSCLSSYGSIICHLARLYCVEEDIDYGSDDCCFIIRDAMMGELEQINYSLYLEPMKKATKKVKKSILSSLKLRFITSLDTHFSVPLQANMGEMMDLGNELSLLGICSQ